MNQNYGRLLLKLCVQNPSEREINLSAILTVTTAITVSNSWSATLRQTDPEHLRYVNPFNAHKTPFYRRQNTGKETENNLPKVTQYMGEPAFDPENLAPESMLRTNCYISLPYNSNVDCLQSLDKNVMVNL